MSQDAASEAGQVPAPYILRRLVAYLLDATLCWIIVALVFAAFADDTIGNELESTESTFIFGVGFSLGEFRPPINMGSKACGTLPETWSELHSYVAPATIESAEICFARSYGLPIGGTATVKLADTAEAGELAGQTISVPLNIDTHARFSDLYSLGLFLALSILCLRFFHTTPGKWVVGLRVKGAQPIPALRRELIRNLPNILIVVGLRVLVEMARPYSEVPPFIDGTATAIQLLAACAAFALWLWPLWDGKRSFFHDRWLGLSVVRAN